MHAKYFVRVFSDQNKIKLYFFYSVYFTIRSFFHHLCRPAFAEMLSFTAGKICVLVYVSILGVGGVSLFHDLN